MWCVEVLITVDWRVRSLDDVIEGCSCALRAVTGLLLVGLDSKRLIMGNGRRV